MKIGKKLEKELKKINPSFRIERKDDCVVLHGQTKDYQQLVQAGKLAAKGRHFYGVINDIEYCSDKPLSPIHAPQIRDRQYEGKKVDVLVIGGGIVGCAILRELSRYKLTSLLIEKENDVALAASSHNDGCVHVGIDLKKKSKKLEYLLRSRAVYEKLCRELDIAYRETGQSVAFTNRFLYPLVSFYLKHKARVNHVPGGVKVLRRKDFLKMEPNLAPEIAFGAYLPGAGCVSPYELTIALGESAIKNGAEIALSTIALSMERKDGQVISVKTNRGTIYPKVVINAAGAFSDQIAEMMGDRFFSIHPRKGTDTILDMESTKKLSRTGISVYPKMGEVKKTHSKGGGIIPTIDGNILVGPDAIETPDREDFSTDAASISKIFAKHAHTISALSQRDIITYFAGIRAATYEEDFVVQKGKWTKNVIHAAGIQSPGVTAAPAIGEDCARWASEMLAAPLKESWDPYRKGIVKTRFLSDEERNELIQKNPSYGHIVCRCEEISEGEILDAIHSPLPPVTIDGVKRRVRAGMGRCQGGFCQPMVTMLLAREEKRDPLAICKKGEGKMFYRHTKGER